MREGEIYGGILRILKNNGQVILTTPQEGGIDFPFLSKEESEKVNIGWGHVKKGYSLEKIKDLFEKNNLSVIFSSVYFNILSRFLYGFSYIKRTFMPTGFLFRASLYLEPYLKYGGQDNVIVARK